MGDAMAGTVLVTGGTGFVGGWTIVELLKRGYAVRTTIRSAAKEAQVRQAVATQVEADNHLSFAVADLTSDDGWDAAAAGCHAVLHIASPLGGAPDADLIAAAQDGTLRVLRAAVEGGASRVVMTSSTAACTPETPPGRPVDESDWTDAAQPGLAAYRKSKILAERAAWNVMAGKTSMSLTTILPGAIFGPVLSKEQLGSVGILDRLLKGQPPALPRLAFNITDVRDLADLHIRAMESPAAAGERFIALGDALWYADVARILRTRLGSAASKVPTANMPDLVAKGIAAVNPQMKALLPLLGRTQAFSSEKARRLLGFAPRPAEETVADCGASLVA
jgi:dihydroflavonol-4-reductase